MRRTPLTSLLAAGVALVALGGMATALGGDADATAPPGRATVAPLVRTELVCPSPLATADGETRYTSFTPADDGPGSERQGSAELLPVPAYEPRVGEDASQEESGTDPESEADAEPEAVAPLAEPGLPATAGTEEGAASALSGVAEDRLAPGWTVHQTTVTDSATGAGLLGTSCQRPDTEFWFAGASLAETRQDYVHLVNPEAAGTVVDIEVYGPEGRLPTAVQDGVTVPGGTSVQVRLSTAVSGDVPESGLAVRVSARTGRIGAQIEAADAELGRDWLAPVSAASGPLVLPGIPEDATSVQLVAFTPGEADVDLAVQLAGAAATLTPAGNESLYLRSAMVGSADLGALTQGEPGSLLLTPAEDAETAPVIAGVHVVRGEDGEQEMAFIPATAPVERRASIAGNEPGADRVALSLAAPGETAEVRVTLSPGDEGGSAVEETYVVQAGTTVTVRPEPAEDTEGRYAITVELVGGGPLHASRMLTRDGDGDEGDGGDGGVPAFTIGTLPDDRSWVTVPDSSQDLSILRTG